MNELFPASPIHLPAFAGALCLPRLGCLEMNQNSPALPTDTSTVTNPQPIGQPLDVKALAVALAGIRADSQRESETYLRDTVVPHGGE